MIMSMASPEQTVIARIVNRRAHVIYNTFNTENDCGMQPKSAWWVRLHIVHFVKVLSPTTFVIVVGSASASERSETLRLHVGLSSCSITLMTRKLGQPECTLQDPCQGSSHKPMRQIADGMISMAYIMRHDGKFLMRPGDSRIKTLFREIDGMFRNGETYFPSWLPRISHYCHIELQAGYFCGSERVTPGNLGYGYLFASDWIGQGNRRFMIVIMSMASPEQTVIARIVNRRAYVIYNTFNTENDCGMQPKSAWWVRLHIVHFVKVLSPTTFVIVVGSASASERSETLRLHVGLSSCSITRLAKTRSIGSDQ